MRKLDLFPTAVGMFDLNRSLTDIEKATVLNLDKTRNTGNFTSSENYLLNNLPELKNLASFFQESIDEYCKEILSVNDDLSFYITQCWANFSETGQFHHKHSHPNSYLSGVFYMQSSPEDKIYFFNKHLREIRTTPKIYNLYNAESWWLEAEVGKLYIFPSNLEHMVQTVSSTQTRISISFNTFFKGIMGSKSELTELILE